MWHVNIKKELLTMSKMFVNMKILDVYDPESFGKFILEEMNNAEIMAPGFANPPNTPCYPQFLSPSLMYIRPRRKYDQVQRKFHCLYPNCKKSYGSISHLNTHIKQKRHGKTLRTSDFVYSEKSN
eukprot:NODE_597_length_6263_cov_0.206035.p4 type:complete len:125 gc:universal NODE_597_length_6263_cov_0.206035:5597-5971(+)